MLLIQSLSWRCHLDPARYRFTGQITVPCFHHGYCDALLHYRQKGWPNTPRSSGHCHSLSDLDQSARLCSSNVLAPGAYALGFFSKILALLLLLTLLDAWLHLEQGYSHFEHQSNASSIWLHAVGPFLDVDVEYSLLVVCARFRLEFL